MGEDERVFVKARPEIEHFCVIGEWLESSERDAFFHSPVNEEEEECEEEKRMDELR